MTYTGIALSGKAGAGKTSVAVSLGDHLGAMRGQRCGSFAIADPLKAACELEWGITKDMPGGREALERYGAKKRAENPLFFVELMELMVEKLWAEGLLPIIHDLRLIEEYDQLRDLGFYLVRVTAPMAVRWDRVEARGDDPNIVTSQGQFETELDGHSFDHKLFNYGSLSQLVSRWVAAGLPQFAAPLPI